MVGRFARARNAGGGGADYWPGFVDALASLLLVIIFLLSIFVLAHFFLSQALSGRDEALSRLDNKVAELSTLLGMEQEKNADLTAQMEQLRATLQTTTERAEAAEDEVARLSTALGGDAAASGPKALERALAKEREVTAAARAEISLMNQQMAALREQIASLQEALEASEARDKEQKAVIADLGKRLNAALAQKVQELAQYRSEFFGRLSDVLGDRDDIEIVGDRFVFQSEVLFGSGSATINGPGKDELAKLAQAIIEVEDRIPSDINWILRVDGHSDIQPIATSSFPTNWHLSNARALAVVDFLIRQGVKPKHLAAAGFGEHQPLDNRKAPDAYRRNRRIEFKLTER